MYNATINEKLMNLYKLMYTKTGPRQWWPADTDFEMIIGALLAQFVAWKNVETAIGNLKEKGIFSLEGICDADDMELEGHIRSTRFYKQKARKIKEFCTYLRDKYDLSLDAFLKQDMYKLRKELLSLYGVGEETADSIILYAAHKPIFVVDAYTRRVYNRLGYFKEDISYSEMQKFFMENLEHDEGLFNEYHAQIDWIGSQYCFAKNPNCDACPLEEECKFKGQ